MRARMRRGRKVRIGSGSMSEGEWETESEGAGESGGQQNQPTASRAKDCGAQKCATAAKPRALGLHGCSRDCVLCA